MSASDKPTCGKWMPRAEAYCARGPGHTPGLCASPDSMQAQRVRGRARVRNDPPEAKRQWRAVHRLKRYGLTKESFRQLLAGQGYACAATPRWGTSSGTPTSPGGTCTRSRDYGWSDSLTDRSQQGAGPLGAWTVGSVW